MNMNEAVDTIKRIAGERFYHLVLFENSTLYINCINDEDNNDDIEIGKINPIHFDRILTKLINLTNMLSYKRRIRGTSNLPIIVNKRKGKNDY